MYITIVWYLLSTWGGIPWFQRPLRGGREVERETAKGKTQSKEKGLWPQPLRISLPCWYLVQILSLISTHTQAWPWTSDITILIGSLYVGTEVRLITWKWATAKALVLASGFSFCNLSLRVRPSWTRVVYYTFVARNCSENKIFYYMLHCSRHLL